MAKASCVMTSEEEGLSGSLVLSQVNPTKAVQPQLSVPVLTEETRHEPHRLPLVYSCVLHQHEEQSWGVDQPGCVLANQIDLEAQVLLKDL